MAYVMAEGILISGKHPRLRCMATIPVQVRLPKELAKTLDNWVKQGKYASRSDAIKTIVAHYQETERTRLFYKTLLRRSKEAKERSELLLPLEKIS